MTSRPWWTPAGAALRALDGMARLGQTKLARKTAGPRALGITILAAMLYGTIDIFGIVETVKLFRQLQNPEKREKKERKDNA